MKLKMLFIPLCLSIISLNASAGILFEDSFELGDHSATNSEGFSWKSGSWTSIVSATTEVYGVTGVPFDKANASDFPGGDWTPRTGNYSMRFRYAAGHAQSEQRFDMGTPHRDIWIRYWLRVPTNYAHSGANRKFFALWMDGYSAYGNGPTIAWEFWPNSEDNGSNLAFHYTPGGYTGLGSHQQKTPFISYPADQGRWMQVVLHAKASTNTTSNDGVIQMWQRWENEGSFRQLHNTTTANIPSPPGGPNGWKAGYVMGWANSAYSENTEWLMDDFTISDTPLIIAPRRITSLLVE